VVDPTGAGDSFAGGALGFLDRIRDRSPTAIRQAMAVGTLTASFCVEGFGPGHFESVSAEALLGRLEDYCRMTDFGGWDAIDLLGKTA
jgi:sugar/nucleoside kinase (ribokinase family)